MTPARKAFFLCVVLLVTGLSWAGCNNNSSSDAAEKDSKETANATKSEDGATTAGAAEAVPEIDNNLYPDFPLEQFSPEEKAKLVKLTKAELCPCPESSESMHECVQNLDKRCEMAVQVMNMMGGMVKASYNQTDILDAVAEFVDAAKRQHSFDLKDRPFKGDANAPVIIVEFADFECPYCKHASAMMGDVVKKYGPQVAIYYKHYPLPAHQFSELASRASVAAHRQGKFWQMHDQLFKNQKSLSASKINNLAQRIGLNLGKFKADLESPEVVAIVAQDRKDGEAGGLTGTPTIFMNGHRYLGDLSEEKLHGAIDKALRDAKKTETTTTTTN